MSNDMRRAVNIFVAFVDKMCNGNPDIATDMYLKKDPLLPERVRFAIITILKSDD